MQESGLLREYCLEEYRDRILVFHRDYATGCGKNTAKTVKLDPDNPVSLKIWHYYNGTQQATFEDLLEEFNATVF